VNDNSLIYYFSATGNSYDIARQFAKGFDNSLLIPIALNKPSEQETSQIGFVFPVYYGTLPRLVETFIRNLPITPGTYCYAVVTMGLWGSGALTVLDELLMEKGLHLSYGKAIKMPRNYIVEYNPLPVDAVNRRIAKANEAVNTALIEIKNRTVNNVKKIKFISKKLYKNIEQLDSDFRADEHCSGCGLCVRICPVDNIKLVNNTPEWQHHCEHCMACIHWCPQMVIQYGSKSQKRRRYHHPNVAVSDLILPLKVE